jgi:predicted CXXCH cytochrome family protein
VLSNATEHRALLASFPQHHYGTSANLRTFSAAAFFNTASLADQLHSLEVLTCSDEKLCSAPTKAQMHALTLSEAAVAAAASRSKPILPRSSANWSLACLLLVLTVAGTAFAAKHPVPLDPKADPSTCIACHEDKTKGKAVHSAMAMGCTSCHEIRTNKDVTRVKLITTTPYALCLTCHADKKAADIKGTVHPPAVRDCIKCHDPHSSENKNQLLKATSGDEKQNLCLNCHTTGIHVPDKGSRHTALDMGCDTCHTTHKTGEVGKVEFDFHLTKATPALCLDCHDASSADLQKAHQNQPFAKADCLTCHDPHQSAVPKLMAKFTHPPFADKQCDVCHAPAKDGKVVLTQADAKSLCVTCHDDKAKLIESAKVQHLGAAGDCTDCHNPHASSQPGLPKTTRVDICLGCHSDIADLKQKRIHHEPAFKEGCSTCHEPHGGEYPRLLRASTTNALCLECHGPDAEPKKLEREHVVAIFDGKVRLPENYFNRMPLLPLKYGLGHPTERHPVSDAMNPKTKAPIPMTCLTCHQAHAGNEQGMLVKDQKNNMDFCKTCHANAMDLMDVRVGGE